MPSPQGNDVTIVVIQMNPGWIYVKVIEPKPEPDRIEPFLRLAIDQWFSANPQFVIDKTQAVTAQGSLQGINVWYHVKERQSETVPPEAPKQLFTLVFEVHKQVFQQVPKEHLEAVVDEALEICRSNQDWHGTLVVISPSRIAVILDKQANRGAVLPFELVYPALEDATRKTVQAWLEAPPARRHVVLINGSWFMPTKIESRRSEIVEPAFRCTNLTYYTRRQSPKFDGGGGYAG